MLLSNSQSQFPSLFLYIGPFRYELTSGSRAAHGVLEFIKSGWIQRNPKNSRFLVSWTILKHFFFGLKEKFTTPMPGRWFLFSCRSFSSYRISWLHLLKFLNADLSILLESPILSVNDTFQAARMVTLNFPACENIHESHRDPCSQVIGAECPTSPACLSPVCGIIAVSPGQILHGRFPLVPSVPGRTGARCSAVLWNGGRWG